MARSSLDQTRPAVRPASTLVMMTILLLGTGICLAVDLSTAQPEDVIGIVMVQLANHRHLDHRLNISQLTAQAIIDPHPAGPPRIKGFLGRLRP